MSKGEAGHIAGPYPVACYACGKGFGLAYDTEDRPLALHAWPYCRAYEAISTVADAVAFSKRCRASAALGRAWNARSS